VSNLLFGIKPAYDEACLCGACTLHTHSAHVATARTASCQCYHKLYKPRDAGFAVGFALGCAVGSSAAVFAASFSLIVALSSLVSKPLFQPLWSWHISHSFCPSRHSQNGFLHALHLCLRFIGFLAGSSSACSSFRLVPPCGSCFRILLPAWIRALSALTRLLISLCSAMVSWMLIQCRSCFSLKQPAKPYGRIVTRLSCKNECKCTREQMARQVSPCTRPCSNSACGEPPPLAGSLSKGHT